MIIKKHKKGVIFTLLALILSTMFVLLLTGGVTNKLDDNLELPELRADMVGSYHDSFVDYSDYALRLSARTCLKAMTKYMVDNALFYDNQSVFFSDLKFCINNSNISQLTGSEIHLNDSENYTINKLLDYYANITENEYDISTDYEIGDIHITLEDVYGNILVNQIGMNTDMKVTITSNDKAIILSPPAYTSTIKVYLEDIYDPYYSTYDLREIENVTVTGGYESSQLTGLSFNDFLDKVDYIHYSEGYSIINRIINNNVPTDNGVISFVDRSENLPDDHSYVDIYHLDDFSFNKSDLYCEVDASDNCINDFSIDAETFKSLEGTYNLSTENWEPEVKE